MTLGDEIRGHLPYLRRYARALTGSQQHGDNFVHVLLEAIVAAPDEFRSGDGTRIDNSAFDVLSGHLKGTIKPSENSELTLGWTGSL